MKYKVDIKPFNANVGVERKVNFDGMQVEVEMSAEEVISAHGVIKEIIIEFSKIFAEFNSRPTPKEYRYETEEEIKRDIK